VAEETRSLITRANQGDTEALKILKERSKDWTLELVAPIGFTKTIRETIAKPAVAEGRLYALFSLVRESELLAQNLAGPNPSPLERLLAEQISVNWLAVRAAEVLHEAAGKISIDLLPQFQSRIDAAHRRLMTSIKTLAQVQRLQIPALVQVNIAEQNVNMG
jgi:hypothetical protein